jgi:hypothetical protein
MPEPLQWISRPWMRCPAEVCIASPKNYEGTPEDLDYPQMCSRCLCQHGTIEIDGERLFPGTGLTGWSVGLKPVTEELMEVWVGRLLLGQVNLAASKLQMEQKKCKP